MSVKMIVGLGNPGSEYESTRHNAGYQVVDRFIEKQKTDAQRSTCCNSLLYTIRTHGRHLRLVKPLSFMNNSGEPVAKLARRFDLQPAEILLVYDCLDLPLGRIRIRPGGGSGGHNGVSAVIEALGTQAFPRLRVGIGRPEKQRERDYVLSPWRRDEEALLREVLDGSVAAIGVMLRRGIEPAMNVFNAWSAPEETEG